MALLTDDLEKSLRKLSGRGIGREKLRKRVWSISVEIKMMWENGRAKVNLLYALHPEPQSSQRLLAFREIARGRCRTMHKPPHHPQTGN